MRSQKLINRVMILLVVLAGLWRVSTRLRQQSLDHQLVLAIGRGGLVRVKSLVSQGANIHTKGEKGVPLLAIAEAGAHTRRTDQSGPDPHKVAIAGFLLDQIVRDKITPAEQGYVLDLAVDNNRVDIIKRLLNSSTEEFLPVMDRAAQQGRTEIVELLIARNIHPVGMAADVYALHSAVGSPGGLSTVRMLLQRHPDVTRADQNGGTALMEAAGSGQSDTVRLLLKHGAKVNARTVSGDTALTNAVAYGHLDIVKDLIAHGADVNVTGTLYRLYDFGMIKNAGSIRMEGTPLQIALRCHYPDIARLLKQAGGKE